MLNTKPNVMTNHITVTIAPVHDHTRHQECKYTNQTHVIVQFSILNCSVSYYWHSCIGTVALNTVFKCVHCPDHTKMSIGLLLLSEVLQFSQDKLKNRELHRNRDFRDQFLRFRDIRDQLFKKGTLWELRDPSSTYHL